MSPDTVRVKQGDTVTVMIGADEAGTVHLHGYDIEQEVEAGEVAGFLFVAGALIMVGMWLQREEAKGRSGGFDSAGHPERPRRGSRRPPSAEQNRSS